MILCGYSGPGYGGSWNNIDADEEAYFNTSDEEDDEDGEARPNPFDSDATATEASLPMRTIHFTTATEPEPTSAPSVPSHISLGLGRKIKDDDEDDVFDQLATSPRSGSPSAVTIGSSATMKVNANVGTASNGSKADTNQGMTADVHSSTIPQVHSPSPKKQVLQVRLSPLTTQKMTTIAADATAIPLVDYPDEEEDDPITEPTDKDGKVSPLSENQGEKGGKDKDCDEITLTRRDSPQPQKKMKM